MFNILNRPIKILMCFALIVSKTSTNYIDYLLTFEIHRHNNLCAKVFIETFIYDDFVTLKYQCPSKIHNV